MRGPNYNPVIGYLLIDKEKHVLGPPGEARDVEPDYVELVSLHTLKKIERIDVNGTLIAIAAYVEGVRLIDNTIFGEI